MDHHAIEEDVKHCGPDLLGRYLCLCSSNEPAGLELHLSRCWRTANYLGVRAKDLVNVGLTHEAAHFVPHIAIGRYMHTPWEDFKSLSDSQRKNVAQVAFWVVPTVFERPDPMKVMRTLARHQSDVYNSWIEFEKRCFHFLDDPPELIAKLTLEVANVPGRQPSSKMIDMYQDYDINE